MSNMNNPPLCANGCGFYGNPTQHNLCSKCYKDSLKQAALQQEQTRTTRTNNNNKDDIVTKVGVESGSETQMNKKMKKRCGCCKKRVGLTGFECRCGEVYCGSHRYPELHSCPFDFKGLELESLSKTLFSAAECKADKLHYRL
ncbi:putative zinc finger A20 and AN1 domain-containing stress-associated protein 8 [Silene latifolia]|uniref:putative zinc finger A20 and AN1 domain-containing stress-associated protein 8 n=1 Tax=Silene latifolia TaxID=37657 RepID=UPI003D76B06E